MSHKNFIKPKQKKIKINIPSADLKYYFAMFTIKKHKT